MQNAGQLGRVGRRRAYDDAISSCLLLSDESQEIKRLSVGWEGRMITVDHVPARSVCLVVAGIFMAGLLTSCTSPAPARGATAQLSGIHKIKHVIIVMQENRSFDSYFGTFPGADGIPTKNGIPTV